MIDGSIEESRVGGLRERAASSLFFLGLALAGEKCGLLAHGFSGCLAAAAIAAAILCERAIADPHGLAASLVARTAAATTIVFGIAPFMSPLPMRGFAVALVLIGTSWATAAMTRRRRPILDRAAIVAAVLAFVDRLIAVDLSARHAIDSLAIKASRAVGHAFGAHIEVGPSMSGVAPLSLALFMVVLPLAGRQRRSIASSVAIVAVLILIWALTLAICALSPRLFSGGVDHSPMIPPPLWNACIAAVLAIAVAGIGNRRVPTEVPSRPSHWRPIAIGTTLAAIGLVVAAPPQFSVPEMRPLRITLYEKGLVNWIAPQKGVHGPGSIGMFGVLPRNFSAFGHDARLTSVIDEPTLSRTDVLILINQVEPFDQSVVEKIDSFVMRGGGLVVLGDHTADWGRGFRLNQTIEKTAIRFNFDNAEFFIGGWLGSYDYFPHSTTAGMSDGANEAASVIGASLDIRYPAIPLVVGRYGWSEPGDPTNEAAGFMGNRRFDGDERVGDLCLVAGQELGRGRVVCFGDTSAFTNGLMTSSWPFVMRSVAWAGGSAPAAPGRAQSLVAIVLVVGGIVGALLFGARPIHFCLASIALLTLSAVSWRATTSTSPLILPRPAKNVGGSARDPVALIDVSHLPGVSLEGIGEDGLGGLIAGLLREGYLVLSARRFEPALFERADLIVVCSPTRRYSAREVDTLAAYVASGGAVLLAAGRPDLDAIAPLVDRFGFRIENIPLGHQEGETDDQEIRPQFWNAWECGGGRPLARVSSRCVAAEQSFGRGRVILTADSHFLRDKSLEPSGEVHSRNVAFLGKMLEILRKGDGTMPNPPDSAPTEKRR